MLAPCFPCPIWLCALQPVFKASAGGDTLSSAPWLLYKTSPVYLPSAGITLNTHLSHTARLGKSPLCLSGSITVCLYVCVCVCGWDWEGVCHQESNCVLSWGFHFYLQGYFHLWECLIWHRRHLIPLSDYMLWNCFGSHIKKKRQSSYCLLWRLRSRVHHRQTSAWNYFSFIM